MSDKKLPTGMRRARLAKRAQIVLGLAAGAAMLWRMLEHFF